MKIRGSVRSSRQGMAICLVAAGVVFSASHVIVSFAQNHRFLLMFSTWTTFCSAYLLKNIVLGTRKKTTKINKDTFLEPRFPVHSHD